MNDNEDSTPEALSAERIKLRQIFRAAQSSSRWDKIHVSLAPIDYQHANVDPSQIFNSINLRMPNATRVGDRQIAINTGRSDNSFWSARLRYSGPHAGERFRVYSDIWINPTKWERLQRAETGEELGLGPTYDRASNIVPIGPVTAPYNLALRHSIQHSILELLECLSGHRLEPNDLEATRPFSLPSFGIGEPITVRLSGWILRHWESYVDLASRDARLDVLRAWERAQQQLRNFTGRVYSTELPDDDRLRAEFRRSDLSYSVNFPVSYRRQVAIYAKAHDRVRYEVRWSKGRYSSATGPQGEPVGDYSAAGLAGLDDFLQLHRRAALSEFQSTAAKLLAAPNDGSQQATLQSFTSLVEIILRGGQSTELKVDAIRQLVETGSYLKTELDGGRDMLNYLARYGVVGRSLERGQPRAPNEELASSLNAIRDAFLE